MPPSKKKGQPQTVVTIPVHPVVMSLITSIRSSSTNKIRPNDKKKAVRRRSHKRQTAVDDDESQLAHHLSKQCWIASNKELLGGNDEDEEDDDDAESSGDEQEEEEEEEVKRDDKEKRKKRIKKKDEEEEWSGDESEDEDGSEVDEDNSMDDDEESLSSGGEEDDSGVEVAEDKLPPVSRMRKTPVTSSSPSSSLSLRQQQAVLDTISFDSDKLLQVLLFQQGFCYTLYSHQFLAARRVAGVPDFFPLHRGSRISSAMAQRARIMTATLDHAVFGLERAENKPPTKGLCLADVMGLGKTVEAVAGAILLNAILDAKGEPKRPILIVSPNETIQKQWRDTLLSGGIPPKQIVWVEKSVQKQDRDFTRPENTFILLTCYKIQTEVKRVFELLGKDRHVKSVLFPSISRKYLAGMRTVKRGRRPKLLDILDVHDEKPEDTITRILRFCQNSMRKQRLAPVFRMIIVDEESCLKNRMKYWTIGAASATLHSFRSVLLTGTPYNNSTADLASIMTMIDPAEQSATSCQWDDWMTNQQNEQTIQSLKQWHNRYLLRRDKSLVALPKKIYNKATLHPTTEQLAHYMLYERKVVRALSYFPALLAGAERGQGNQPQEVQQMFQRLMAGFTCLRQVNIHPLVVGNGRDITARFSPSRRYLVSQKGKQKKCNPRGNIDEMVEGEDYDDECFEEEYDKVAARCSRLLNLEDVPFAKDPGARKWCRSVDEKFPNGFPGSPKLDYTVDLIRRIPKTDKILVFSFFKKVLDLLEGILVHDLKMEVARFDGDIGSDQREEELELFRENSRCRVLLMTVKCGGVGLTLTEANHVIFTDRWWNPLVHEQAEDRAHRLTQKKDVTVHYIDVASTVDEAMCVVSEFKMNNSKVLLPDGIEIGHSGGSLSQKDLSGMVGRVMKSIEEFRSTFVEGEVNEGKPIPSWKKSVWDTETDQKKYQLVPGLSISQPKMQWP